MTEKRSSKRVRINMKVAFRDDTHAYKMGRVGDISRGGMYVDTGYKPDVGGYIIASLDAEEFGKIIWVQGRVAWKTYTGMGIAFTQLDEKGLDNVLSSRGAPF